MLLQHIGRYPHAQGALFTQEFIHLPQTQNTKAYNLAHNARKQLFFVVHMDSELPIWLAQS